MIAVETQTSTYLINKEEGWIQRVPGDAEKVDTEEFFVQELRKDKERIPLIDISEITVGEDMIMILDLRGDGVVTIRRTTPVKSIVNVDAPQESRVDNG